MSNDYLYQQEDLYANYEADRYIHYLIVRTNNVVFKKEIRNGKEVEIAYPVLEEREISFEEVKNLNLDHYGMDVRTSDKDFTLVHNYLLDFWSSILGSDAILLYIHLKRYCYGDKDYCFPNLDEIAKKMNTTKQTIRKLLDKLEDYNFIVRIYRKDKHRKNAKSTILFKVRRYVPLLSEELIAKLPERLQELHDKFLATCSGIHLNESHTKKEALQKLLEQSKMMNEEEKKEFAAEKRQEGNLRESILLQLDANQLHFSDMIKQEIEKRISKPSYETFIEDSFILLYPEYQQVIVITPNLFVNDFVQDRYQNLIKESIYNLELASNVNVYCLTYEQYIYKKP
jgi:DNA-binding MarR family transcriptional regulator